MKNQNSKVKNQNHSLFCHRERLLRSVATSRDYHEPIIIGSRNDTSCQIASSADVHWLPRNDNQHFILHFDI